MNKSAASADYLDSVKFQAVIESAVSAASRKPKSREGSSRGAQDGGSDHGLKRLAALPDCVLHSCYRSSTTLFREDS